MTYVTFKKSDVPGAVDESNKSLPPKLFPTGSSGFHIEWLGAREELTELDAADLSSLESLTDQLKASTNLVEQDTLAASIETLHGKRSSSLTALGRVVETTADTFAPWLASNPVMTEIQPVDEDATLSEKWRPVGAYLRKREGVLIKDRLADNPAPKKAVKIAAINKKTRALIAAGFQYSGMTFSLSPEAQVTWIGMYNAKGNITPVEVGNIDDTGTLVLNSKTEVDDFYEAAQAAVLAARTSGLALKKSVIAATTEAGVDAIVDTR